MALWYTLMAIANETGLHEGLSLAVSTLAEAGLSKSGAAGPQHLQPKAT